MKKKYQPKDLEPVVLQVSIPKHLVESLKKMEEHTKKPIDELARIALAMFVATHNDYMGLRK